MDIDERKRPPDDPLTAPNGGAEPGRGGAPGPPRPDGNPSAGEEAVPATSALNLPDILVDHPDGEIRARGHRIGLHDLGAMWLEGRSPGEIDERYPTLGLDLIRQILAFCDQNRAGVSKYLRDYREEQERRHSAYRRTGPSLDDLRKRMASRPGIPR